MVEAERVSVRVIRHCDGVPYTEYTPRSTSTKYHGRTYERYIGVSTNERYCVKVDFLPGFQLLGQPGVRVIVSLDNVHYICQATCRPSDSTCACSAHLHPSGILLQDVPRNIDGQRMDCGVTFGQLESDEDVTLDAEQMAQALEKSGRIVVTVQRGSTGGKIRQRFGERSGIDLFDNVDDMTSCKEIVYKYNISHVTKHVPLGTLSKDADEHQFIPATGSEGKPIIIVIRYRSHEALNYLGIINDDDEIPQLERVGSTGDSVGQSATSINSRPDARDSAGLSPDPSSIPAGQPSSNNNNNNEEEEPNPCPQPGDEPSARRQQKQKAHAEIPRGVRKRMAGEAELNPGEGIAIVKRMIRDKDFDDPPALTRHLSTFANAVENQGTKITGGDA